MSEQAAYAPGPFASLTVHTGCTAFVIFTVPITPSIPSRPWHHDLALRIPCYPCPLQSQRPSWRCCHPLEQERGHRVSKRTLVARGGTGLSANWGAAKAVRSVVVYTHGGSNAYSHETGRPFRSGRRSNSKDCYGRATTSGNDHNLLRTGVAGVHHGGAVASALRRKVANGHIPPGERSGFIHREGSLPTHLSTACFPAGIEFLL